MGSVIEQPDRLSAAGHRAAIRGAQSDAAGSPTGTSAAVGGSDDAGTHVGRPDGAADRGRSPGALVACSQMRSSAGSSTILTCGGVGAGLDRIGQATDDRPGRRVAEHLGHPSVRLGHEDRTTRAERSDGAEYLLSAGSQVTREAVVRW